MCLVCLPTYSVAWVAVPGRPSDLQVCPGSEADSSGGYRYGGGSSSSCFYSSPPSGQSCASVTVGSPEGQVKLLIDKIGELDSLSMNPPHVYSQQSTPEKDGSPSSCSPDGKQNSSPGAVKCPTDLSDVVDDQFFSILSLIGVGFKFCVSVPWYVVSVFLVDCLHSVHYMIGVAMEHPSASFFGYIATFFAGIFVWDVYLWHIVAYFISSLNEYFLSFKEIVRVHEEIVVSPKVLVTEESEDGEDATTHTQEKHRLQNHGKSRVHTKSQEESVQSGDSHHHKDHDHHPGAHHPNNRHVDEKDEQHQDPDNQHQEQEEASHEEQKENHGHGGSSGHRPCRDCGPQDTETHSQDGAPPESPDRKVVVAPKERVVEEDNKEEEDDAENAAEQRQDQSKDQTEPE